MKKERLEEIISEEVLHMLEVSMTRKFRKAVEELQKVQLAQQQLRKKFVAEKDPKKKEKLKQDIIKMHKVVQKAESDFNSAIKAEPVDLDETVLVEDVFKSFLADDPGNFKLHVASNTDKRKSVMARKTDRTWDDGVPVLKFIARAPKKPSPLPKGKFKIIEDNKYGWWYYQVGRTWYGISQGDYGTPPFEY